MDEQTPTSLNIPQMLAIAQDAARQAGRYLTQKLGTAKVEHQKSPHDDLLDADLESERIILSILRAETPTIGILSEEAGTEGEKQRFWIVDPLDGSANFQHGNPTFAIALALVSDQTTIGSVIYLPVRDEMFTAIRHEGAYLNGTHITVSDITTLDEAIAHVGDPVTTSDTTAANEYIADLATLARQARRVRMIGTAATDLAYGACGRADMLINYAAKPWDIEAGKLLLSEAGGQIAAKKYSNGKTMFLYTNENLHKVVKEAAYKLKSC